ncbi:CopY/TcrY family copper transport repressor [Limosilactobacillus mucosae]|uniref:CopY/TcrY family copper transport repressor n=1 Tax=Limosilactobacillus mucosae TaxID=97478 RepID=UPI00233E9217|nr:CopY/TcrY family copper transport repressor [Limosilactobacillus mucosae]MDC2840916.1 CopY/TcrY family copper transport repressor [Limosilactobacillus mucosae]
MENSITPAEWQVMRVAWTLGHVTSTEMIDILQCKVAWKPATIKTLLRRLVQKGALKTTRVGRAFVYEPQVEEQPTMNQAADELFDNLCEMHVGKTLLHVIEKATLSQSDINQLQDLLAKKTATAPAEVPCNCVPGMRCQED